MALPSKRFARWLRKHGFNVTRLRLATADVIPRYSDRMTSREIQRAISGVLQSSVSEMSVYRNLRLMEDAKIIRHVVIRKGTPGLPRQYFLRRS